MTGNAIDLEQMLGADWRQAVDSRRSEIVTRIAGRTDVLLFGTGYLGRHVRADLRGQPYRAVAFVDNNRDIWGSEVDGLEVSGPDEAVERYGDRALWLITIYTNSRVIEQCRALGVPWVTCAELSWVLPEPHPNMFVFGIPERLAESSSEIEAAASIWADAESEEEYQSQVRWRFLLDYAALKTPRPIVETYFPDYLIRPLADEVFVDCGAFTGDTIEAFLTARGGSFGEIVGIEPDVVNCRVLQERIDEWARSGMGQMRVEPVAVGSRRGTLTFDTTGTAGSKVGAGTETVEVAPLDEILAEDKPTYIKFDVEGAEHDAIVGGTKTIRANMPVLAVCLYHKPEDLWDVPLLVRSIRPDYKMYVRRYSDERWETVLYAVPPDRVLGAKS
jgi:FkbM family methyltransferase